MTIPSITTITPFVTIPNSSTAQEEKISRTHDTQPFLTLLTEETNIPDRQLVKPPETKLAAFRRIVSSTADHIFRSIRPYQPEPISSNTTNVDNLPQSNPLESTDSLANMNNQAPPHSEEGSQHSTTNDPTSSLEHSAFTLSPNSSSHEHSEQGESQGRTLQNTKPDETTVAKSDVEPNTKNTISNEDPSCADNISQYTERSDATHDPSIYYSTQSLNISAVTSSTSDTINQKHEPVKVEDEVNRQSFLRRIFSSLIECAKELLSRFSSAVKACFKCVTPSFDSKNNTNNSRTDNHFMGKYTTKNRKTVRATRHNNINAHTSHDTKNTDARFSPTDTHNSSVSTNHSEGDSGFTSQVSIDEDALKEEPSFQTATATLCKFFEYFDEIQKELDILKNTSLLNKISVLRGFSERLPTIITSMNRTSKQFKEDTDLIYKSEYKCDEDKNIIIFHVFTSAFATLDTDNDIVLMFLENIVNFMLRKKKQKDSLLDASIGLRDALNHIPFLIKASVSLIFKNIQHFNIQLDCTYEPMIQALLNTVFVKTMKEESLMADEAKTNRANKDKKKEIIKTRKEFLARSYAIKKTISEKLKIKQCD